MYTVVKELLITGVQVPVIPLLEIVGRMKLLPQVIGLIWVKLGVVELDTFIIWVYVSEQPQLVNTVKVIVNVPN